MGPWRVARLTDGTDRGVGHSHSYYDVPVFDSESRYLSGHALTFAERHPKPDEPVEIGVLDLDGDRTWRTVGESRAWSWQQGPLTQFVPGTRRLVWNDREGESFVARLHDLETGDTRTLPAPVYAVAPDGRTALSLNMARLDELRPGYGYPGGAGGRTDRRHPGDDGVRRLDLETGETRLILPLARAVRFLYRRIGPREALRHLRRRYTYWFNHAKISPDGRRFTVKLRWRGWDKEKGWLGWNDRQGVSLTCGLDGSDPHLLARGTSHVIWLDNRRLYMYRRDGVFLYEDSAPRGRRIEPLAPDLIEGNVHIRHLPPEEGEAEPHRFVFDTPYRREIDLLLYDRRDGSHARLGRFENHAPERGPFRCDLHPCPSPDGRRIVVTSLHDGLRQIYLLERGGETP